MARRRYYRRSVRVVPAKKKWASNIVTQRLVHNTDNPAYNYITLVSNSTESSTPTPIIIKTGNFKVQVDAVASIETTQRRLAGAIAMIIYLPQGYALSTASPNSAFRDLMVQHPEWIMAWKQLDFSSASGAATSESVSVSFSSRLKRNLNSGDKIVFGVAYQGDGYLPGTVNTFMYQVAAQYWTCSN